MMLFYAFMGCYVVGDLMDLKAKIQQLKPIIDKHVYNLLQSYEISDFLCNDKYMLNPFYKSLAVPSFSIIDNILPY